MVLEKYLFKRTQLNDLINQINQHCTVKHLDIKMWNCFLKAKDCSSIVLILFLSWLNLRVLQTTGCCLHRFLSLMLLWSYWEKLNIWKQILCCLSNHHWQFILFCTILNLGFNEPAFFFCEFSFFFNVITLFVAYETNGFFCCCWEKNIWPL